ncbi:transposase [Streptomyces sp. NPDC058439]|uniref:transposase n=1 Tax=Streptomyces sp. NPDC058439 TaxID=3346500 RepID=UPI0036676013
MPQSWDGSQAAGRRAHCRIPDGEHHRPKWQLALEMLDDLATVGLRPAVLVAVAGCGANADFRHALEDRGLVYALQVKGELTAHAEAAKPHHPPYGGLGPSPAAPLPHPPVHRAGMSDCGQWEFPGTFLGLPVHQQARA